MVGMIIDGRYCLDALIGRGGMGSVFRATHITIRRTVAVKLLHPSLVGIPEIGKRFHREAYAIGRIEHPNCVNVSDFGTLEDGSLYLVMEYLQGRSLAETLEAGRKLEPLRALQILRHILRGLGHAHEAGIVHRDIKPENVVLVEHEGDPDFAKILDFGIAKLIGEAEAEGASDVKLTQAGVAFGTPIYMSPEQAVGNPIDGRADLYGASVLGYEMLTGRTPFYSEDKLEVLSMHTSRPVPPMNPAAAEVPTAVEQLIARGLAKRPDDRFASAADYIAAIDATVAQLWPTYVPHPRQSSHGTTPVAFNTPLYTTEVTASIPASRLSSTPPPHAAHHSTNTALAATPARAVPTQNVRRRSPKLAALLGAAAVVLIAAAFVGYTALGMGDEGSVAADAGPKSLADRAAELVERGEVKDAVALINADPNAADGDPALQMQLGHAFAAQRMPRRALEAYRNALRVNPLRNDDPKMRANLVVMLEHEDGGFVLEVADVLLGMLQDERPVEVVAAMASSERNDALRHRALEMADSFGFSDRVDRVKSYTLDLVRGDSCEQRREAVIKLRALGDKRALEVLEAAKVRQGRRGRHRRVNLNRCLYQDAVEAMKYLESLADPAAMATPPATQGG